MNDLECDDFLTYYYRSPVPERATEALRFLMSGSHVEDACGRVPTAYFFARMAQENPGLLRDYEQLFGETQFEGDALLSEIIADLKSIPQAPSNALARTVRTPTGNDLLWAEFFVTGSNEPIERLIEVLERPDRIRQKLEAWLTSPLRFFRSATRCKRTYERLRTAAGVACNTELTRIETLGDLDCLCLMQGVDLATEIRFFEVRRALPFRLTENEIIQMSIKATAKWSLASNANRHPCVLETCEEQLAKRQGSVKMALQEIVDKARLNQDDYAEAMKTRQTADTGDPHAQQKLAIMYQKGRGVHCDPRLAAIWFRKAAEQGEAEAQHELGLAHRYGEGVQEDKLEAEKWTRKAAEQGMARAQRLLGQLTNGDEALKWTRRAAEQGLSEAQYDLGVKYWSGDGVSTDYNEAVRWYRQAAEQGLPDGQYALGDMYYNGLGVREDYAEAAKWFRKGAEQGDTYCEAELEDMYANGLALPPDPEADK